MLPASAPGICRVKVKNPHLWYRRKVKNPHLWYRRVVVTGEMHTTDPIVAVPHTAVDEFIVACIALYGA
jgi:hypothetical protein